MEKGPKYSPNSPTLFESFHSFESPNLRGVDKLQKELSKYKDFKPRLTFRFPLDKERLEAIDMIQTGNINNDSINKLLKSKDLVEKMAGKSLRDLFSKKHYPFAKPAVREEIENLVKTGSEKALPVLSQMLLENPDWTVKVSAAEALSKISNKNAIEILKKWIYKD